MCLGKLVGQRGALLGLRVLHEHQQEHVSALLCISLDIYNW
jgi:hypothetical protein